MAGSIHAALGSDPIRLGVLNIGDQLHVFGLGQHIAQMLDVRLRREEFARDAIRLIRKFADMAVELQVGHVELRLARGNMLIDLVYQPLAFEMVEMAIVLVHVAEIGGFLRLRFVIAAFQAPDVEPMCRAGLVHAEKIVADGNPLVHVFLHDAERHRSGGDNSLEAVVARAEMEGLLAQHRIHGLGERLEAGIAEHGELEFTVAVHEIGVREEIEPVADFLIEGAEEAARFKGAALEHFLRLDAAAVAEMVDEEVAHLPAVAHFLGDHAAEGFAVVLAGRMLEEAALLFDGGKLRIALIDDQIEQAIANALIGNFQNAAPLWAAFERTEFDLVRARGTELGGKLVIFDFGIVHTDVVAPDSKQVHPIVEGANARRGHSTLSFSVARGSGESHANRASTPGGSMDAEYRLALFEKCVKPLEAIAREEAVKL